MFSSPSVALLMLALSAENSASAQTCPPPEEREARCIELTADGTAEAHEIQISPGQITTLLFDSDVREGGMSLEGREHFAVADLGTRTLTLVPAENVRGKRPGTMMVCFADGAIPACVSLRWVVHPVIAERRVEFFRHPRAVDSVQAELKRTREENTELRADIQRLRAERDRPDGLTGLLESGMLDVMGIACSTLGVVQRPAEVLTVWRFVTCRAPGRVAIQLFLTIPDGAPPWTAQGVKLTGPKGEELKGAVWQQAPILPNERGKLYIEVQAENARTMGPFIVKLWDADGARIITFRDVTFPSLATGLGH